MEVCRACLRWTPGVAEADSEEPDEHDSNPSRSSASLIVFPTNSVLSNDTGNYEVAYSHDDSARDQSRLSAPLVEIEDSWDSCQEHDDTNHS